MYDFTVRWEKQRWLFSADSTESAINRRYYGKIDKVFFLVKWSQRDGAYAVTYEDQQVTGHTWFESTLVGVIQTIMADRAGFTEYERYKKKYPTVETATPTGLLVGHAQIYVVRYRDNSRWWYTANDTTSDPEDRGNALWASKMFTADVLPSKEHVLKYLIRGTFGTV